MLTRSRLRRELSDLGLAAGDLVMVHASMRAVGPVLGGPDVVLQALLDVLGPAGTLAAYIDWEDAAQPATLGATLASLDPVIREEQPAFDPRTGRTSRSHGVLPEFLRTWPGAVRSGNPGASVAAVGARAAWLCADHPLDYGYGPGSPFAKLVEADGSVLLLGSPLANVTLLHHSEHVARLPGKRVIRYLERLRLDGEARWVELEEFDTGRPVVAAARDEYFEDVVTDYLAEGRAREGTVGRARALLLPAPGLHAFAVDWMERRWGG